MSRYDDGYGSRDRADHYTYSTGGPVAPPPYPRVPSPGHTTYNGKPQARLTYEPQEEPYYPPRSPSRDLHSRSRPRSLAPPIDDPRDRDRGHSDDSDDGGRARAKSPIEKAKRFVDNTFTDSTTGLGVGVLGALVGGLAAREAVELTSNREKPHHGKGHHSSEDAELHKRTQLISTVVGAAVGALGANAVEKRIEARRARDEVEQKRWERKWRRPEGANAEVLESMEVVARPRPHSRGDRDRDREDDWDAWDEAERGRAGGAGQRSGGGGGGGGSRHGVSREVDRGARSWRNVEDWLLDDGDDDGGSSRGPPRSGRHRSRESYRH
ncbi:hypothetical protein F5Y07DRAFT_360631 [Xylaria sp. FL0933]|nr:hypothetical protein F5Y07DRAFT_360631 [Xylaria sp. FL0933]